MKPIVFACVLVLVCLHGYLPALGAPANDSSTEEPTIKTSPTTPKTNGSSTTLPPTTTADVTTQFSNVTTEPPSNVTTEATTTDGNNTTEFSNQTSTATPSTASTSTASPASTKPTTIATTSATKKPSGSGSSFDVGSFFGGIGLVVGLVIIAAIGYKCYKQRSTEGYKAM